MLFHEKIDRLQNEFHVRVFAQFICQRFVRTGVKDGREVASAILVEQVGNVRQQIPPDPTGFELPIDKVGRYFVRLHSPCHLAVSSPLRIGHIRPNLPIRRRIFLTFMRIPMCKRRI